MTQDPSLTWGRLRALLERLYNDEQLLTLQQSLVLILSATTGKAMYRHER